MKKILLFVLFSLFNLTLTSSQDMLTFPDDVIKQLSDIPLDACVRQSSDLIENIDMTDGSQAGQLRIQGYQLLNLGQHEYAKEVFEKAMELNKNVYGKEDMRYVKSLIDLAHAYMLLIRYNEAAGLFEEARTTIESTAGTNSLEYLNILNESVLVYSRIYDWKKGISLAKEGINLIEKTARKGTMYETIFRNNLAICIKNTYNYPKAIEEYEKAFESGKNVPRFAISLAANLAEVYALVGKKTEAKTLLDKYKPLAKKVLAAKNLTFARVWMQYGVAYTALKAYKDAEDCFKQAFITNSITYTDISSIPNQAEDLMMKNNFLATCGQAGIMMYTIEMYKQRYEANKDINALKDGYKIVQALMKYGEKLINSYLSEENKLILFRLGAAVLFDRGIYYAHELYQNTNDKQFIEDAFFYSERSKSTLLVNALQSKESQAFLDLPKELIEQQKEYKRILKDLQKEQIEVSSKAEKDKIQQSINELNIKIENFKKEVQELHPEYYQHHYNITLSNLDKVQEYLSKKNNVLIEYALGLENHYAFVVTKDDLQIYKLAINPMEINEKTQSLRKTLTDYKYITRKTPKADSLFRVSSHYFYATFVEPLMKNVKKGQHLIVVPDQMLGHLPFETFLTEAAQKVGNFGSYPYLIKQNPISYSYSATILLGNQRQKNQRTIPKQGVLAFAAEYPEISENSFSHQRGGNIGVVREGLQPLPGATKEVEMMSKHLLGEFYNGQPASEKTFKDNAHNYGVIHLAMHGVLDNKNPILSALVFTEDSSEVEDNFLRAYEIAQLDLNAELVVLSACETGYGKFQQGEGVMSLAHSFSYAGASSVLMSLWQVNDFSTSKIMKNFYVNLAKGFGKEKALREAKLDYIEDSEGLTTHPAFWAAFIQTGDVAPLDLYAKSGKTFKQMGRFMITMLVLLILGLAYGIYRWRRNKK